MSNALYPDCVTLVLRCSKPGNITDSYFEKKQ
jgi:hypothetical protein